jgi:predicted nucleic acid-binding protein
MEEIEAKKRYQDAVDKSNQSNRLLMKEKIIEVEDDDAEMALSLARARRIALLEQKKKTESIIEANESKVDEDIDDLGK